MSPNTIPLSIWVTTVSGLTAKPQSTAQTTRRTTGALSFSSTSATWATML